jgi:hypothetical protein
MQDLPLLLADSRVHCNTWEIAFAKQLVQFGGPNGALNEDDDLVKLKIIEKLVELSVLLAFAESDCVLLKTVQGKFGLIVHIELERISHELSANGADVLR